MDANTYTRADTLPHAEKLVPTDAEEYLLRCAETGDKWEPRDLARHNRNKDNITSSYGVPPSCIIRASLIRTLLTGAPWFADGRPLPVNPKGLWIEHAYIADTLDLQGCHVLVPLWMKACALARGVRLRDATTQTIGFNTSLVGLTPQTPDFDPLSIDAVRARVNGKLYLADGFQAFGEVNFASAHIAGQMECRGGHFHGSEADRDT